MARFNVKVGLLDASEGDTLRIQAANEKEAMGQALESETLLRNPTWAVLEITPA